MTIEKLIQAGKKANQDSWHVVGLPWNNQTPYINTQSEDPHQGKAIIDCIDPDYFEGEDDADIERQEQEAIAEGHANMQFIAEAANNRAAVEAMFEENKRLREALEDIRFQAGNAMDHGSKCSIDQVCYNVAVKALKGGEKP